MTRTMTATEARIHFGELLQIVNATDEPVIVEKSGEPVAYVLSPRAYRCTHTTPAQSDWIERARRSAEQVSKLLNGRPLPDVDEMINIGHGDDDDL